MGGDITHTCIDDLRVELLAPSGQQAILHHRSGSSRGNLIQTYDAAATPALALLVGHSVQGNWVLRVMDLAGQDIGKLNRWSLELTLWEACMAHGTIPGRPDMSRVHARADAP